MQRNLESLRSGRGIGAWWSQPGNSGKSGESLGGASSQAALFAARQRSQGEYDKLAEQCGFRGVGTTDTAAGISVLEYEAV